MADWRDATGRRVRKGSHTREDATNYQASMRKQTLAEKSKARGQSAVIRSLMQSIKRSEKKKRAKEEVKTTVTLPVTLYAEVHSFANSGVGPADSINDFIVVALLAYVKLIKRKQIDSEFALMAEDAEYQKSAKLLSEEFSSSDWEAFERVEKDA